MSLQSAVLMQATQLVAELPWRASFDIERLLCEMATFATESVPGAQYAGITVTKRGRDSRTATATHRYARLLDEIASRCQQGPSRSVDDAQHCIRVDDLGCDDRWPVFREEALRRTPIRSILSFRISREHQAAAALSLYAEPANAFDDGSVHLALILATHASLAWSMLRRDQQYRSALASRDTIGQAKGMLMERFNIDPTAAFELLKRVSQESNIPVVHIARRLVAGDRLRR